MTTNPKNSKTLTAGEAVEEYQKVATLLRWNKRVIGTFCQANVVEGMYDHTLKQWVLERKSLEDLIDYVKRRFDSGFAKQG